MPNRLAAQSSPYLLQHAANPVDWHPWGEEALARARAEERPIFLSIGYSACHWCHVMEHECFENAAIAEQMNRDFINIKVDREERPDLDAIYMTAVQMLTGRGGWPMSVFLTPDLQPFFGGTYWPPAPRHGLAGFGQVLSAVADAWKNRRQQAIEQAAQLTKFLRESHAPPATVGELSPAILEAAGSALARSADRRHGGFGAAPKFPHPLDLRLLLRIAKRKPRADLVEIVTYTLDKMAAGGIYDQLGGGFHRYSVDERWLVPHFEKMLYDNALLAGSYLDGYLATGRADYARVARETLDYVLRDLTDPAGGFYSTEDADSEGEEGRFYVWTPAEVEAVLGGDLAATVCYAYDVTDAGNFERHNILNMPKTIEQVALVRKLDLGRLREDLARARQLLLARRETRVRPHRDDKVLANWNGLMINSLAQAAGVLDEPRYLEAASKAAAFILEHMHRPDGRLLHSWRGGTARFDAYLDDYSCLINGLVSLYEAGFDERNIDQAIGLADIVLARFVDAEAGGFFYTADDHETLIARHKDLQDNATPSGNAMAATALLRLGKLTGRGDYLAAAERTIQSAAGLLAASPTAAGQMLVALDMYLGPTREIVILGEPDATDTAAVLADLRHRFAPNKVLARRPASASSGSRSAALDGLFEGKTPGSPPPTVYICENFACQEPIHGQHAAVAAWDHLFGQKP